MGGTDTGVTGWGILTLHACLRPTVRSTGARPRNCLDCLFGVAVTGLGLKLAWSTVGRKTDHAARARVCDLLTGSACGQFSGTLLYWLHHWWCNIMISFVILEGNERKTWKYLEVNYLVSRKTVST